MIDENFSFDILANKIGAITAIFIQNMYAEPFETISGYIVRAIVCNAFLAIGNLLMILKTEECLDIYFF